MALIKCETCGKEISINAMTCPHCGEETALSKEKRHKKKKIIAGVVFTIVLIQVAVLFVLIGVPKIQKRKENKKLEHRYDEARRLASEGELEKAKEIFISLGDYKDCEKQVNQCEEEIKGIKYEEGLRLQSEKNFQEAADVFESLGDYKDSEILRKEIKYEEGLWLLSEGKYDEAADVFKSLGDYKDSEKQRDSCRTEIFETKYQEALQLFKKKQLDDAYEIFAELDGYKDSNDKMTMIRFAKNKVGEIVLFGTYEQDGNIANGSEPIEWIVLAKEKNRMLLFSKYFLDWRPFHNEYGRKVTWATCSLREWINGSFYQIAFNLDDQKYILKTEVDASENQCYKDTDQGKNTIDKVFLLSADQATKYSTIIYKACDYTVDDCMKRLEFAKKTSDVPLDMNSYLAPYGWWTRTMGDSQKSAAYVQLSSSTGIVCYNGQYLWFTDETYPEYLGVRPAIWISIE